MDNYYVTNKNPSIQLIRQIDNDKDKIVYNNIIIGKPTGLTYNIYFQHWPEVGSFELSYR